MESKKINLIKNIAIVILMIAFFVSVKSCFENKKQAFSATEMLSDSTKYFKNKLGTETASKMVLETSNKLFKETILKKDLELKKLTDEFSRVKSVVKYKTKFEIDTVNVVFVDSIPCEFERIGSFDKKHFKFDWEFNQNKFQLKNINIENETTLITGFKRKWIFGRQTLTTDITNSNEFIKTTQIKTIELKIPKTFHETRLFNFSVGLATGFLIFK